MWNRFFSLLVIPQDKQENVRKFKIPWLLFLGACVFVLLLGVGLGYVYFQVFFTNKNWKKIDVLNQEVLGNQTKIENYQTNLLSSFIQIEELQNIHTELLQKSGFSLGNSPGVSILRKLKTSSKTEEEQAEKEGILSIIKKEEQEKNTSNPYSASIVNSLQELHNPSLVLPNRLPVQGLIVGEYGAMENNFYPNLLVVQGLLISMQDAKTVILPLAGVVSDVGIFEQTGGYFIEVYHGFGVKTIYVNLKKQNFQVGDRLSTGEDLGLVEHNSISNSALLYYQILLYGIPQNPLRNLQ